MEQTQKCYQQNDGRNDWRTDEGHSYNPPSASWWGINKNKQNLKLMVILYEFYETSKSLFHLLNDHECKILFLLLIKYNVYLKQNQTLLWTCVVSAHLQCVNNHYAKFEYEGMQSVWDTDYTQITQCKHSKGDINVLESKFKTPKYIIKCA